MGNRVRISSLETQSGAQNEVASRKLVNFHLDFSNRIEVKPKGKEELLLVDL